jgi:stalled ribosome rescue protein Dom34
MFCQVCGSGVQKDFKFCSKCGNAVISSTTKSKRTTSLENFEQFKTQKSEERRKYFNTTKDATKKKKMEDQSVIISIGVGNHCNGIMKPVRGKCLPLKVSTLASSKAVLEEALKKRAAYDRSFRSDRSYNLCYPDGTEVINLPGTNEAFTLQKY